MILYPIGRLEKELSKIDIHKIIQERELSWNQDMLNDQFYGKSLQFYLLLSYGLTFCGDCSAHNFYNRYYWFLTFVEKYKLKNGDDAGLEQQAFKLLAEVDSIDAQIDWDIIEQLHGQVIKEVSSLVGVV